MATPHVSGAAALLWAAAPGEQPTDISSALLGGVDALPAFAGRTVSGGRLNVLRSLRMIADVGVGAPTPAPEPGGDSGTGGSGSSRGDTSSSRPAGEAGDRLPPRLSIRTGRRYQQMLYRRHRLRARVRCSEACTVRVVLRYRGRDLAAPMSASLAAHVSRQLVLRLNRSGRALLRHHRSAALTLRGRATDPVGNRRRLTVSLPVG